MTGEEIFNATPEVIRKAVAEAQNGLSIYGLNPKMRETQPGDGKGPEFRLRSKKLVEYVKLIHVQIHVGDECVGIVVRIVRAQGSWLTVPHEFALEILPERDPAHDAIVHAALYL